MTNKQLLARIEELERRVRDLEARPVYVPYTPTPYYPYPGSPWGPVWVGPIPDVTTCGGISTTTTVSQ